MFFVPRTCAKVFKLVKWTHLFEVYAGGQIQHITTYYKILHYIITYYNILQHITTYYSMLKQTNGLS